MTANAWTVRLNGREVDTVFFDDDCDADYVVRALRDHDGYDPAITVSTKGKVQKAANRA